VQIPLVPVLRIILNINATCTLHHGTSSPHNRRDLPTIEETPPQQQKSLLPVEKLKKLCLKRFNKYGIKEFRFNGEAESLKDFLSLCFFENGKYVNNRIVWITENAFVRLDHSFILPEVYRDRQLSLKLFATANDNVDSSPDHELNIHSTTTEEAIAALDLLAGLQDSYFKMIFLLCDDIEDGSNGLLLSAR
jgi:hypothetical protein